MYCVTFMLLIQYFQFMLISRSLQYRAADQNSPEVQGPLSEIRGAGTEAQHKDGPATMQSICYITGIEEALTFVTNKLTCTDVTETTENVNSCSNAVNKHQTNRVMFAFEYGKLISFSVNIFNTLRYIFCCHCE